MIQLTEQQRQVLERGEPMGASWEGRDVVLLRSDIYRRIQSILEVERAVIAAGHTRGPATAPEPFAADPFPPAPEAIVMLPVARLAEIKELVADARQAA